MGVSDREPDGRQILQEAVRQVHWGARGYRGERDRKLRIGIVKSKSDVGICYAHLDELTEIAITAMPAAGGIGFAIPTTGPCDGLFFANDEGGRLGPSIERMAADVEMMARGAALDAMVFLPSCDTTTPAHLVA